ncbi:MAG: CotH kinase family protein [Verrucomicrobia bacterium]|nr:CotH kinase family protein [Verrucomicrobiota bacterium]
MTFTRFAFTLALLTAAILQAIGDPEISEILASNSSILEDVDGEFSDWVEIHNPDAAPVDLAGYSLTDSKGSLAKWVFPSVTLPPEGFLVVFASGKDRTDPAQQLHTNFKLSSSGEYLALVKPDGKTIAAEFSPQYPEQFQDESYGPGISSDAVASTPLLTGASAKWIVPMNDVGDGWREQVFDDGTWQSGKTGLGFGFDGLVDEAGDLTAAMRGVNATAYARIPFEINNSAEVIRLSLRLKYEDGFVAWINGQQVAADNEPELPAWNSTSTGSRSDALTEEWETYSVEFEGILQTGTNVLAVQLLNSSAGGSDLLFLPEIDIETIDSSQPSVTGYLLEATPGARNARSSGNGPRIFDTTDSADISDPTTAIPVTARIQQNLAPVAAVTLHYRVMYAEDVSVPMLDDGAGSDKTANDGIFSATVPGNIAETGQMVRWAVVATDADGAETRSPRFPDPKGSPEYFGTVVVDPTLTTKLPVLHRFMERASRAETNAGTRASIYFDGDFYDNIFLRIRGGTAVSWPKKSYKVDFNQGSHFRFKEGVPRVDEINLNATYTDKSYIRARLTAEVGNDAGTPSPETIHFRMHQNGEFFSLAYFVEQPDKDFLRRHNMDTNGALYKGPPGATMDSTGAFEKKSNKETRTKDDLQQFITGIKLRDLAELEKFVFDNVDIPAQVNFLAVVALTQNIDGSDKNYFLYRDTFGTGEWQMLPWDLDLTFGPDALNTDTIVYKADRDFAAASHVFIGATPHLLHTGKYNRLIEAMIKTERTKDMLLRRVRTLADQFLATDYFPKRIDELNTLLAPDVDEDRAKWKTSSHFGGRSYTLREASDRIINDYLVPRLRYLTIDQATSVSSGLTFIAGDGSPVRAFVPSDGSIGTAWTAIAFDDSAWLDGTGGVGFDRGATGDYLQLVGIDLLSQTLAAESRIDTDGDGINETDSIYMRYAFDVPDPALIGGLSFGMKYDDGYIAYLNGTKIAEKNAPGAPSWDSTATASHSDSRAIVFENIDVSARKSLLVQGKNVLAIHGLNEGVGNSDLLFVPRLADEGSGNDDAVGIPPAQAADATVEFGKIHSTGSPTEHFIELTNPGTQSVDLSGWKLTGAIQHTFKPGTVVLAGERLYVSPDVAGFRSRTSSPTGGEGQFVQGNYTGELRNGQTLSLVNAKGAVVSNATLKISPSGFAQWAAGFFPAGSPSATPEADPDLDGSPNVLEFALATNPTKYSAPAISVERKEVAGVAHLEVTFTRPAGESITYSLEQSTSMTQWAPFPTSTSSTQPDGPVLEKVTLRSASPVASESIFVRIRVQMP